MTACEKKRKRERKESKEERRREKKKKGTGREDKISPEDSIRYRVSK